MSHDEFCTVGFSIVKYRGSTEVEGEMSALLTTTHDPLCPVARSIDMNLGPSAILILCLCVPLMDARADEREKAALRIEALADREERESLMTWGQHFVHLGAFEACAKLVRGGEQE